MLSIFFLYLSLVGTVFFVRRFAWHIRFEEHKELKKNISLELMPIAWHPKRWVDWCLSEDEKREIDPMFIEEL